MQTGAPEEIFGKPVNSQVASFAGFENMLKGRVISTDKSSEYKIRNRNN